MFVLYWISDCVVLTHVETIFFKSAFQFKPLWDHHHFSDWIIKSVNMVFIEQPLALSSLHNNIYLIFGILYCVEFLLMIYLVKHHRTSSGRQYYIMHEGTNALNGQTHTNMSCFLRKIRRRKKLFTGSQLRQFRLHSLSVRLSDQILCCDLLLALGS